MNLTATGLEQRARDVLAQACPREIWNALEGAAAARSPAQFFGEMRAHMVRFGMDIDLAEVLTGKFAELARAHPGRAH